MNPFILYCRCLEFLRASAGVGSLAVAGLLCAGRRGASLRRRLSERVASMRGLAPVAAAALPVLLAAHKVLQYRACEMTTDDANTINMLWRVAHGVGLSSYGYEGASYLSNHFSLVLLPLAPFFLSSSGPLILITAQSLALGSVPLAAYLWAKEVTSDGRRAGLTALAVVACPIFWSVASSILIETAFALPLALWALYFVSRRKSGPAAALLTALVFVREEVPLLFFGFGLAEALSKDSGRRRRGGGLMAMSILLWAAEMRCIGLFRAMRPGGLDFWGLFDFLTRPGAAGVAQAVLHRPFSVAGAFFFPPVKIATILRVAGPMAFLPFAGGAAFLPALVTWIPHQLARAGHSYQQLHNHHGAIVLAALAYAFHFGYGRAADAIPRRRRQLDAVLLICAAWGLLTAPGLRVVRAPAAWFFESGRAVAEIPRGAKVWSDDYLIARVADRRYVASLPRTERELNGFVPDRVIVSAYWARLHPVAQERLSGYLRRGGYAAVYASPDLAVLARPSRSGRRSE